MRNRSNLRCGVERYPNYEKIWNQFGLEDHYEIVDIDLHCSDRSGGLTAAPCMAGTVTIEKTTLDWWENCYRITNGEVELIAVADIGPRILRFGFVGGDNVFSSIQNGGQNWGATYGTGTADTGCGSLPKPPISLTIPTISP